MKEESDIGLGEITLCLRIFAVLIVFFALLSWFGLVIFFANHANM